jgi:sulfate transport system substrate-binding protein
VAAGSSPRAICNISTRRRRRRIISEHFNRPIDKAVAAKHASDFGEVRLVTVEDVFGGWKKVTEEHLADGGILDRLYVGQ